MYNYNGEKVDKLFLIEKMHENEKYLRSIKNVKSELERPNHFLFELLLMTTQVNDPSNSKEFQMNFEIEIIKDFISVQEQKTVDDNEHILLLMSESDFDREQRLNELEIAFFD